jgi:hypothetical protein
VLDEFLRGRRVRENSGEVPRGRDIGAGPVTGEGNP